MITGARQGSLNRFRRFAAAMLARDLHAVTVPGPDVFSALGLDPSAVGVTYAATPRHAQVLVLAGPLPPELREAAAVAYAQMPRPRVILALGTQEFSPLPDPDVTGPASHDGLAQGLRRVRELLSRHAFSPEARAFEPTVLATRTEYTCPMHPEIIQDEPGTCPKCGMELVPREASGSSDETHHHTISHKDASAHDDHAQHEHGNDHGGHAENGTAEGATSYTCPMHPEVVQDHPGRCPECGMFLVPADSDDGAGSDTGHAPSHAHHQADSHPHDHDPDAGEVHEHGAGMDFMSMVEVTKDLPRGRDGLPMDRIDVPFGPLFPGLPGGLLLTLTLAGDAVAQARARTLTGPRSALPEPGMPAARFIEHLGSLDPLAPATYRLLARRALEAASGFSPSAHQQRARLAAAERERAASHLGWLAQLARQVDLPWLERRATRLQLTLIHGDHDAMAPLGRHSVALRTRLERTPLLAARLMHVGALSPADGLRGPVARAAGMTTDARTHDPAYAELGFEPVLHQGGDALIRLHVRLEELTRSLRLAEAAGTLTMPADFDTHAVIGDATGDGQAVVETPRGEARLHVHLDGGLVTRASLDTPSAGHLTLLPELLTDLELGDALVAAGSLDISPWEASAS